MATVIRSVQFSSVAQSCPTLCDPMNHSTPGLPVHHQLPRLPKLMSIESVMPSNHLILFHPLLLPPSMFSSIRVFSNESALRIRWPKYWSFSFNISPSNESFQSVQSVSRVWLFVTPWTTARQDSLSFTNSRIYPNSCPLSQWCHLTISSSATLFSFCLQCFPASGSFPRSRLFPSGGQIVGISSSASVSSS